MRIQTLGQGQGCQGGIANPFVYKAPPLAWACCHDAESHGARQRCRHHTRCRLGHTGYLVDGDVHTQKRRVAKQSLVWLSKLRNNAGDLLLQAAQHCFGAECAASDDATEMQGVALCDGADRV
jgi:hypothetical protein